MSETATGGAAASQAAKQLTRQQKAAAVVISLGAEKACLLYTSTTNFLTNGHFVITQGAIEGDSPTT